MRESSFLKVGENLEAKTGNVGCRGYGIRRIFKPLREKAYRCEFENGAVVVEKEKSADLEGIFGEQLYWLIDSHFTKRERLAPKGIKCLSLIFIDRVDNYVQPDGIIRRLFAEKYRLVCKERLNREPSEEEIAALQGYYFAQTGKGEYTDNERAMRGSKELFDLILKQKEELLRIGNPVEFIFSHSALGVGWDNPNVFNIATLNQSYSEIKKRQEIGRGLRICVNQDGQRVYDAEDCPEGEEVNLLTVVPNETYETFVAQYQSEIKDVYGTSASGAKTRHKQKGRHPRKRRVRRNEDIYGSDSFREFWRKLSQRTDYTVVIDDDAVVSRAVEALNALKIEHYSAEVSLNRVQRLEPSIVTFADTIETPNRGIYDRVVYDSSFERDFAGFADNDDEVVCFLKLPAFYQIQTPIGPYNPDFGVVFRPKRLKDDDETEFYFVVETKGTNELTDKKALRKSEVYKIKCAMKHFDALGVDARIHFEAPVKEYPVFKSRAREVLHDA